MIFLYKNTHFSSDFAEIWYGHSKWLPDSKNCELRPFLWWEVIGWLKFGMKVLNGMGYEIQRVKAILTLESGWLVSRMVNLVKWAKIAISESIWQKFGMDIPNGP